MAVLSQGTTVTIGGSAILATRVVVTDGDPNSNNAPRVSVAHLGSNPDEEEPYELTWAAPADSSSAPRNVQIDYMGGLISPGGTVSLSVSGPVSFSATCTVVSSVVTAQVGDVVRGTATLRYE